MLTGDTLRRLCRARDALAETGMPVRQVARAAGISPFHFIRTFESLFGVTPHQFRIQSRLMRAKVLLAGGEHSVTEVCFEVGFESLGSFSDLFARRVGSTPSAFRRSARVMVAVPGILPVQLFPGCLSLMGRLPAAAFRNFGEAQEVVAPVEFGHANQTHEPHGAGPGQGAGILYTGTRV